MLTEDIGKRMLRNILEVVLDISDKEYQKRVWIRGEGPEIDDFTETVCKFFDNGDPVLNEHEKCGITKNQYQVLKNFSDKFRDFSDTHDFPEEFIDTPEWAGVMSLAKDVLKSFNYSKTVG
jgi:hypothetical protein